jgi:outer membrane receptor protein involved in Fe transport
VGRISTIDGSDVNAAHTRVGAWDLRIDYNLQMRWIGSVSLFTLASMEPLFATQLSANDPLRNVAGMSSANPPRLRANGGLTVEKGRWLFGWRARFVSRYLVSEKESILASQPTEHVRSQDYHDLVARYQLPPNARSNWSAEIQFGIRNVFKERPPFDAANEGTGYVSPFGDPRPSTYSLSIGMSL